jgi:hypothetical protein
VKPTEQQNDASSQAKSFSLSQFFFFSAFFICLSVLSLGSIIHYYY